MRYFTEVPEKVQEFEEDFVVDLVINTSTSKMSYKDGRRIRHSAVDYAVLYVTTIQAAMAAADAIEAMSRVELVIKSIGEYYSGM